MKKTKKCALFISLVMMIAGAAIFFIAFAIAGFKFQNLSAEKITTQNFEIKEPFQRISVSSYEYDLNILKSEDEKCRIVYTGDEKQPLVCNVMGKELVIDLHNNKKWYENIGLNFQFALPDDTGITVYLPEKEYEAINASSYSGAIDIESGFSFDEANFDTSSGNIKASGMTAEKLDIQSYSGKIDISEISSSDNINVGTQSGAIHAGNVDANNVAVDSYSGKVSLENLIAKGSLLVGTQSGNAALSGSADSVTVNTYSGRVNLENAIAKTSLSVETQSGNVVLNDCDAGEITVDTYSGSVSGSLLSDKIFVTSTYSGSVNVPISSGTEICTITTQSGNINLSIQ